GLTLDKKWEVHQALIDILEETAHFLDLTGDFAHPRGQRLKLRIARDYLRKVKLAKLVVKPGQVADALAHRARLDLQIAHQNFQARDQLVGFIRAEEFFKSMFGQD